MSEPESKPAAAGAPPRRAYQRTVGPRLKLVLWVVFGLLGLLAANSVYLVSITALEWLDRDRGVTYQNYAYQLMFLGHLVLGLLFIPPVLGFIVAHTLKARNRPNRRAVRVGYALALATLVVLVSGLILMRVEGLEFLQVRDPSARRWGYWAHVIAPLGCVQPVEQDRKSTRLNSSH